MRITSPKREARYRQLLLAAQRIFARDGIDGASVADIAESAGVAKGSVYLYFTSKEALAGDLVRNIFAYDAPDAPLPAEDPDPLARIVRFCVDQQRNVEALGEDRAVVLHMLGHSAKSSEDLVARGIRQLLTESRFLIEVLVQSAQSKGMLPAEVNAADAAAAILASTYGCIQLGLINGHMPDVKHTVESLLCGLGAQMPTGA
jgi:TetR/AcrR family transcriptional regulator, transcriptional repressor for nem operon